MDKTIYFLLNLLQDLYILRKLIFLFNDDTDYKVEILVTKGFIKRDKDFALTKEIKNIEQENKVTDKNSRMQELKNWLEYLNEN